jgi:hypothetical protein
MMTLEPATGSDSLAVAASDDQIVNNSVPKTTEDRIRGRS